MNLGLVPGEGLEPSHCLQHRILSPARLPIPPSRHAQMRIIHETEAFFKCTPLLTWNKRSNRPSSAAIHLIGTRCGEMWTRGLNVLQKTRKWADWLMRCDVDTVAMGHQKICTGYRSTRFPQRVDWPWIWQIKISPVASQMFSIARGCNSWWVMACCPVLFAWWMKFSHCVWHYDNATAVVRSYLDDAYNPQYCTSLVNIFCAIFLINPFVNFHWSCFFSEVITDA